MTKTLDDYLKQYQQLHDGTGKFIVGGKEFQDTTGHLFDGSNFYEKLWNNFKKWADGREAFSVLDYGCGKAKHLYQPHLEGKTFHAYFPGRVQQYYCYDPGNAIYKKPPSKDSKFDALICADVLEHVPDEHVDGVVRDVRTWLHPNGTGFYSISGQMAKKSFIDGENLHVNVKPLEYWREKLEATGRRYIAVYTSDDGVFLAKRV